MTMPAQQQVPHRFQALDSLRGVAALIVAIEHLGAQGPVLGHRFFFLGSLWVDFFFVLSGFVIASAYGERLVAGFPARRFVWLRLGRIWPVHALVLAAYLGIELAVWLSGSAALTGREAFGLERGPGDFALQVLLLQALVPGAIMVWSIASWSIAVELVLYLLAAWCWRPLGRGWWLASLGAGLAAGLALQFPEQLGGYHKLVRGLCGFGLGTGCWIAWQRWHGLARRGAGVVWSLAELGIAALVGWTILRFGYAGSFLAYDLLFAAMVLIFACQRGALSILLLTRPWVALGTWSYSLYLVHALAESATMTVLARLGAGLGWGWAFTRGSAPNRPAVAAELGFYADLAGLAALLASVAAAWAIYRLVEQPMRDRSRAFAPRIG